MLTYRIHLIRHGMTQGNMEGRYIGRTDIPLCERGRSELRALKEQFEYPQVDMVVSSPLQRCTETAQILYPERYMEGYSGLCAVALLRNEAGPAGRGEPAAGPCPGGKRHGEAF